MYTHINCVVFVVLGRGSGANARMGTPWPHQQIKAHDNPSAEIAKLSTL